MVKVGRKRVTRLPVHHHSADCIFFVLWDNWAHMSQFDSRVPLKLMLRGVGSVGDFRCGVLLFMVIHFIYKYKNKIK